MSNYEENKKMNENYLPQKWRNKVFRFQAGGYSGCICHPAALIIDREGDVHLIRSDGGDGGLDENDWYCRKCRAYLDEKGVLSDGEFLYGPKKNNKFYKEFRRLREGYDDERQRRERRRVLQALEEEWDKKPEDIPGWDHEFELIGEIDTEEKVRETCKKIGNFFYDVYFRAEIADALSNAGYDGAGFVCTLCGEYVDDTDYESFVDHINPDDYHGIGGLAVAHTSILCGDCRYDLECSQCFSLTRPPSSEGDSAYNHVTFRESFIMQWLGVCEYCADSFFRDDDNRHWMDRVDAVGEVISTAKEQIKKYIETMRNDNGLSDKDLEELEKKNRDHCEAVWRELVNELRDKMEKDVKAFFTDAGDWADDRIRKGEHYVW